MVVLPSVRCTRGWLYTMSLLHILAGIVKFSVGVSVWTRYMKLPQILQFALSRNWTNVLIMGLLIVLHTCELIIKSTITYLNWKHSLNRSQEHRKYFLCPFALYYLPNRVHVQFHNLPHFLSWGGNKACECGIKGTQAWENFFNSDFEFFTILYLVKLKY